ncbi:hypothetical protein L861_14410 [Litchfieldella anticariensis FP35 = DSM 16096]|uniref:DUF2238 domain-containing protein n=1 Tax=Litchfieldella anticariensis (strain DSM 16096 / CECT 5854 / CIP 108499 / LMG 22089 / FP35) TaxID=1121939 RepID=S2L6Y1_LITA3|nr:DUF2238 domain-containing protein [Halomonas anticariensis]EPC00461.1 hypothetical protein L861_14410 [Halomonas anticariensis FP35 = DSM 16096]
MRQAGLGLAKLDPYPVWLFIGFGAFWVWLAIEPQYRSDWLLENMLVLAAIPVLAWVWYQGGVSRLAWACIFLFLVFHEIGAHYTYSEVPYDRWWQSLFGYSLDRSLGFERNQYDRWAHFLYGLLILPLVTELMGKLFPLDTFLRRLIPVLIITSHVALYELIEWFAAEMFGGELGQAYLGTQGDIWDTQKDMALALLGALMASAGYFLVRQILGRQENTAA